MTKVPPTPRAPMPLWVWWCLAVVLTATFGLALGGFLWTSHAISVQRHEMAVQRREQCNLYTVLDDFYQRSPPATSQGRAFAATIHKVTADLGCR